MLKTVLCIGSQMSVENLPSSLDGDQLYICLMIQLNLRVCVEMFRGFLGCIYEFNAKSVILGGCYKFIFSFFKCG
jgi:hypothetical protein